MAETNATAIPPRVKGGRFTHGMARTPEYLSWKQMLQRCYNPNARGYQNYGGRDIQVCERWRTSFEAFFEDMGLRPSLSHSIERKENNKGYSKDNCVWATPKQQARNRRSSRMLTFGGRTQCLAAWAEELGMAVTTLRNRLNFGWSVERALTTPRRHYGLSSSATPSL